MVGYRPLVRELGRLKLEFRPFEGHLRRWVYRLIDDALGLTEVAGEPFPRAAVPDKTGGMAWAGKFRQSVYGLILVATITVNDADGRLGRDLAPCKWIAIGGHGCHQTGRFHQPGWDAFETELFAASDRTLPRSTELIRRLDRQGS